jgi:hypothetical protein
MVNFKKLVLLAGRMALGMLFIAPNRVDEEALR